MPFKAKQYSRETALSMVKEGSCLGKENRGLEGEEA
jgi:hypothetical protein